ncbi:hypothetical protein AAE478_009343 [Parahypoxylon ruwenzoriense]
MSAPYWGQLPSSKARRMSDDYDDQAGRRQSLDQSAPQPQSRSNRASIQTTRTDAYTESTLSPLVSPVTANFQGAGLAPRPPSLPYSQNRYPPELLQERRRRRTSRNQEDDFFDVYDETAISPPPPPAAPEVPRAPPVSYKYPYRNGSPAYTYNSDGQPGPPLSAYRYGSPQARILGMEAESFYKDATPPAEKQERAPVLDRSRQTFGEGGGIIRQWDKDTERTASIRRPAVNADPLETETVDPSPPKRRATLSAQPQRPTWADDRSPLQKLELTLDSITKEEKRARVEAAERRAMERAARRENTTSREKPQPQPQPQLQPQPQPQLGHPTTQHAQLRDRRQPGAQEEELPVIVSDPIQAHPSTAAAIRRPLPLNPLEEAKQYALFDQRHRSQIPIARRRTVSSAEQVDLPQRNLSFRERAARNDIILPRDTDSSSPTSPITTPGGGFSLTRSGSNKLKKNPPGDPRYGARREAEEKPPAYYRRGSQAGEVNEPLSNVDVTAFTSGPQNEAVRGMPTSSEYRDRPPARGKQFTQGGGYEEQSARRKGFAAATGLGRTDFMGSSQQSPPQQYTHPSSLRNTEAPRGPVGNTVKSVKFPDRKHEAQAFSDGDYDSDASGHGFREYMHRDKLRPGRGMYQPPKYLNEWKHATVGTLSGALLDFGEEPAEAADKSSTWWESQRRGSITTRTRGPEAFNGAYDDTQGPTRFKPPLYLKCGPLLRYCGIRREKPVARVTHEDATPDREVWRGSVMIVTQDSESSYDIAPILRLFVQPIELLPPPPAELRGEQPLLPEYVDPILGIPKLGRQGETLYVRPVEHLEEGKDASMLEPDDGLFEITRSSPDFDNAPDPPGSFANRKKRTQVDGEKLGKYRDVRGFRLHAERGHTFWRFNIEVELRDKQQRIAYRINRGPATGFWVPARGQSMNIMFYSCNGFSLSVNPDDLSGPDPMWRDVLNNHQTRPFHVMVGGGDQIYNDAIMRDTKHFKMWLQIKNPLHKNNAPLTAAMQDEMENFYLNRYMMWFSQGLFGLANCQIPMVNMYDDHDIIDGYGSYPHHFMKSPVFTGLGNVAFKYYMLFQHQSLPEETEQSEPSWVLGVRPGPYIRELSRSMFMSLGGNVALLAADCRAERTRDEVVREDTWKKLMDRCYDEIVKGETQHLLVLLGVPIAYPRLVWLENILTSRLMDPIKALGKTGMLGNFLNHFDGGVEVLDDLDDHWTAKNHKDERRFVMEDLQDLAADKSVRVTILSGDVHLAAVGQFYSNPKQNLAKHKDFRYMPNIISSAIANTPPPDIMADILNKRNKVHHFDKETDEDMIPIFTHDVDGKPRNNKRLLPHRNWCSIHEYVPGQTPPPTPPPEEYEITPEGTPPGSRGGLFRRFSLSRNRGSTSRPDTAARGSVDRSRPPISGGGGGGGLLRSFSRRRSSDGGSRPGKLLRTLSLGRGDSSRPRTGGGVFSRRSMDRPDDGGINGDWGPDSEEDIYDAPPPRQPRPAVFAPAPAPVVGMAGEYGSNSMVGLRGGAGAPRNDEYEVGDDSFFMARPPQRAFTQPAAAMPHDRYDDDDDDEHYSAGSEAQAQAPKPFHRTPTGLSTRKLRKNGPQRYEIDLTGGLDVCLNVEVNAKDPAGITVPYRLLVPRLWYEYQGENADAGADVGVGVGVGERVLEDDFESEGVESGFEHEYEHEHEYEREPGPILPLAGISPERDEDGKGMGGGIGGGLKRLFSGRGRGSTRTGSGGSQYRAHRQSP